MKNFLFSTLFIFLSSALFSQAYYEEFKTHLQKGDTVQQRLTLKKWSTTGLEDPAFYTSSFNYHFHLSQAMAFDFESEPLDENSLVLTDSTGHRGYLNTRTIYLEKQANKAHEAIDRGIAKFPNRLDMRFGKIYALGLSQDYKKFTYEIKKTIDYSSQIKEKWLWEYSKPKPDAKNFFLESTYSYMTQLYNTGDDNLLPNIQQIGLKINEHYPNYIPVLSMLGVTYILSEDYDNSIKYFSKANKLAPKDYIVLSNLAESYKRKGDYPKAKKYYKLSIKYGDAASKEIARKGLKEINNK